MNNHELATLTVTALAPVLPYLPGIATGAARELGKQMTDAALARGQKIWEWLIPRAAAQPDLPESLEKLRAAPEDAVAQESVCRLLRELLAKDPAAPAALEKLLQEIGVVQTTIQQTGQGNIAAGRDLSGNKITQHFHK